MEMDINYSVTASARSKVLITGGYLIIDASNEGIVLQTSPKFHCRIEADKTLDPLIL